MTYEWDFSIIWEYRTVLLTGLRNTVILAIITIAASIVLGLFLALLRGSRVRFLYTTLSIFISTIRAVPVLVLLVWMYYCLPIVTGL